MRRKPRFERKKEYRDKRLERAVKNLEGKNIPKKKMSKGKSGDLKKEAVRWYTNTH